MGSGSALEESGDKVDLEEVARRQPVWSSERSAKQYVSSIGELSVQSTEIRTAEMAILFVHILPHVGFACAVSNASLAV